MLKELEYDAKKQVKTYNRAVEEATLERDQVRNCNLINFTHHVLYSLKFTNFAEKNWFCFDKLIPRSVCCIKGNSKRASQARRNRTTTKSDIRSS